MEFLKKYKNLILAILFILVVIIIGFLLYTLFFKPTGQPISTEPDPTATGTPAGFPTAGEGGVQIVSTSTTKDRLSGGVEPLEPISDVANGGLTKTKRITKNSVIEPTLSGTGNALQYYDKSDGKFYRINNEGELELMSNKTFYNVQDVTWSPVKNKAILEYPDGSNIVYDFDTKQQITLPKHWEDFDFSPEGNQIVMKSMGLDPNNRWLAVSNLDGSKSRPIEPIGLMDETIYSSWSPNKQSIAMYTEGIDFDRQEVYFVGLNDENFKSTVIEGRGFQSQWAPSGKQLLYSVYSSKNDLKPMLWLVNAQGEEIGTGRHSLGVETWAEKCTYANESEVYCAVPKDLPEGAGLFPEMAENTSDTLYMIDTQTGFRKIIATPDGEFNMSNLIISDNGYNLYFTDNNDKRIYQIKLK